MIYRQSCQHGNVNSQYHPCLLSMSIPQFECSKVHVWHWSLHLGLWTYSILKISCIKVQNHLNLERTAGGDNCSAIPKGALETWGVPPSAQAPAHPAMDRLFILWCATHPNMFLPFFCNSWRGDHQRMPFS